MIDVVTYKKKIHKMFKWKQRKHKNVTQWNKGKYFVNVEDIQTTQIIA